ncbi:hypothetical protein Taro_030515 [Colocasia esculenta]|uniref:Low-temperature-induced 65 kDa protein n=1 Tax=Colocasia esculenta TaxID=4460 RepID=A0A843W3K1_COLES|nr:hypothetical protein [Colocasia esculenta]
MAQIDGLRYMEGSEGGHGPWPSPASPAFGRIYDHEEEHGHHHGKKSVLAKVKDVAKKLKHSLSKKRHGQDVDDGHYTRNWGIVLDENDDADFPGAPVYEPMPVPGPHKEAATLQTATTPKEKGATASPADAHSKTLEHVDSFKEEDLPEQVKLPSQGDVADKHVTEPKDNPAEPAVEQGGNSKTLTETVTEILSPAYAAVTEATRRITSKIPSPQLSGQDREAMSKQMWDKGISVKEYLLQKLEPGEDEKALSEVITEAMSPKKRSADAGGAAEVGMVEIVRGAVTSLLGNKEKPADGLPTAGTEIPYGNIAVSKEVRPVLTYSKSQPLPISTCPQVIQVSQSRLSSSVPTTPHAPATSTLAPRNLVQKAPFEGVIEEEQSNQSNGKMLQAYLN